jgi:hypothetical protein
MSENIRCCIHNITFFTLCVVTFYRLRGLAEATGLLVVPQLVDSLPAATRGFPPLSRVSFVTH